MYHSIRTIKNSFEDSNGHPSQRDAYHKGIHHILILFGEVFQKGYAQGLIREAQSHNMKIIYSTMGRRDKNGELRSLNEEESSSFPQPFIDIPLEAGFDFEPTENCEHLIDELQDIRLSEWENFHFKNETLVQAQMRGEARFAQATKTYLKELSRLLHKENLLKKGVHVYFAHLMAGGVPRAKIIMPLMNRSLKGTGERFLSSETFWNSDLGKFCSENFFSVTANTFFHLVNESSDLRYKITALGGKVSYSAFGYHGTEILINNKYRWQTYTPYLQGWAKLKLEEYAKKFSSQGISCCVYNCPEVLTNSSAIFSGVEMSLYPFVKALQVEAENILSENPGGGLSGATSEAGRPSESEKVKKNYERINEVIKSFFVNPSDQNKLWEMTETYYQSPIMDPFFQFSEWPKHNSKEQLQFMLDESKKMVLLCSQMEDDSSSKRFLSYYLSELIIQGVGKIILNDLPQPESACSWINHDVIAKTVLQMDVIK